MTKSNARGNFQSDLLAWAKPDRFLLRVPPPTAAHPDPEEAGRRG